MQAAGTPDDLNIKVLVGEIPIRNNAKDQIQEINPQDRQMQAKYFLKHFPKTYPEYLTKYLKIAYKEKTDDFVVKLIDNALHDREAMQLIGLIQLIWGGLRIAKRMGVNPALYIIEPETHLHPKRQSLIMTVIHTIYEEHYGKK